MCTLTWSLQEPSHGLHSQLMLLFVHCVRKKIPFNTVSQDLDTVIWPGSCRFAADCKSLSRHTAPIQTADIFTRPSTLRFLAEFTLNYSLQWNWHARLLVVTPYQTNISSGLDAPLGMFLTQLSVALLPCNGMQTQTLWHLSCYQPVQYMTVMWQWFWSVSTFIHNTCIWISTGSLLIWMRKWQPHQEVKILA